MNLPLAAQARLENARPVLLAAVLAIVAAFCFVVGTRLTLNRPNARGSLLSPAAWIVLGAVIAAPAAAAALAANRDAIAAFGGFAIAGLCFWRAFAITHADRARAVVRRLSRVAPWAGILLGISLAAVALFASLQSGRSGDLFRAAAFVILTPAFYGMGVSLASLTGEPVPRVRSPKWMSYLVWVWVALLLGSLAMWLAGN